MKILSKEKKLTVKVCMSFQDRFFGFMRKKKQDYAHSVNISPSSFLYQIVGKKQIEVNSFHQFTVIDPKLDVVGTSPDGLIEAIEDKTHPFFIGVQWHPESILEYDIVSQQLFQSFFDAVKKR